MKVIKMLILSEKQVEKIKEYMKNQNEVVALYLYGSYGTKYQTPLSDVDLAFLPVNQYGVDVYKELEFASELQHIGENENINLVNLLKVPVTLQMNILKNGQLLFCKDKISLADFKEFVILSYCDFAPDLNEFYKEYDKGMQEELL